MSEPTSYDRVIYHSKVIPETHPRRLGALARLFGLPPAPAESCRVLEVGCGTGGNLLSLAADLPRSEFVGVDASGAQIEHGQQVAVELGLGNLELRHQRLEDLSDPGPFDYIVAHGVYSWVPAQVRDELLALVGARLHPQGVAFVSYNTWPGWHLLGALREMLLLHAGGVEDPAERIAQSRSFLDFLASALGREPYNEALRAEVGRLEGQPDWYLFHGMLSEINLPVWFREFVAHAGEHGLKYLAEVEFSRMLPTSYPEPVARVLTQLGEQIRTEQYMDFLCNRRFRRTLLCRRERPLRRSVSWEALTGLHIGTMARVVGELVDPCSEERQQFRGRGSDGAEFATQVPLLKAAFQVLTLEAPRALAFAELLERALARLGRAELPADRERLGGNLLSGFAAGVIELSRGPWDLVSRVGERPATSALARLLARRGVAELPNQRHEPMEPEDVHRLLIQAADGTRDRAALLDALCDAIGEGEFTHQGRPVEDPAEVRRLLDGVLDAELRSLARSGFLVR